MWIKKLLPYIFLAALLLGTIFIWYQVPLPCGQPIEYSIGVFDERFKLSKAIFLQELAAAEALWENESGRELFSYVPEAAFRVNLIFDDRQARTFDEQKLAGSLEKTEMMQENLNRKQQVLLAQYTAAGRDYERQLAAFKKNLDAYNSEVRRWNERGGAPAKEHVDLQKVATALEREQKELEVKRQEVNQKASEVNAFSTQKVVLVDQYNDEISQYVDRYGQPKGFDQGNYSGQEINIYQYDDLPHLRAVLVHELGHALGLVHATNPISLMYHLMGEQPLDPIILSAEDRTMLALQCSQTRWNIIWERVAGLV